MNHCPKCGATENVPRRNPGPAIIQLERRQYRAMCLNCWYKAQPATTRKEALKNWNEQIVVNQWRAKREALGLTPTELSKLTNVNREQIYRYEIGKTKPSKAVAKRLQSVLGTFAY